MLFLLLSLVGCSSPASAVAHQPAAPAIGQVRLWQDAEIFSLVGTMIRFARVRVLVEIYELGRNDIVRALTEAHVRHIDVRVITDPSVNASRASAARLKTAGVAERAYPIDDARHQIDHVKLLIVDAEAAVGGMNWGMHSDRNHDYVLETRVASQVERLAAIFAQDWAMAGGHPSPLRAEQLAVAQTAPGDEIRHTLEGALRRARHRVLAEVYTLTDAEVVAELVIAHRRGADVRVILDPNQAYNVHPASMLAAGGVDVRWYPVPRGILLHAKIGLFDGELVLGSANWTVSGLGVNHELDIETSDAAPVGAYLSRFESDWARSRAV